MENYQAVFKRKEVKYLLTESQLSSLMPIFYAHMVPDNFAHSSILNLYYDTPDFLLVRRSLEKPLYKEKLRLRSYGRPTLNSQVFPEIKKKVKGIVYKRRESMPYGDAIKYLAKDIKGPDTQIFHELDWLLTSYENLEPKVFLSYERDSLKGVEDKELRITLDREILWRTDSLDLRKGAYGEPLLKPGEVLMEIKLFNSAPLWLASALSENGVFPISFSKYGRAFSSFNKDLNNEMEIKQYV